MNKHLLFSLAILLAASAAYAQTLEIRTVNEGLGNIGVQVRNTSDVPVTNNDFITGITFGIKWKSRYFVDLDKNSIKTNYRIQEKGVLMQQDSFYYQAFSADNTPYEIPEYWDQNTWIEIMSVTNTLTGGDTGTFQICETGFSSATDPNIEINLIDFTPAINGEANGVVLPVSLLSFTATPAGNGVSLHWATGSETNSRGFDVQRSQSNGDAFASLGFVPGKGGSGGYHYDFTDATAVDGIMYDYRLKQTNTDGSVRFSSVESAMGDRVVTSRVQVSPNPAREHIIVLFGNEASTEPVILQVMDGSGRIMSTRKEEMTPGKSVELPVVTLPAGAYYLVLKTEKGKKVQTVQFQKL